MNEQLHFSEESHFIHATYHCLFILVNLAQFFNIVQDYFLSTIYFNKMKQTKKYLHESNYSLTEFFLLLNKVINCFPP